jgi:hypothetical protein
MLKPFTLLTNTQLDRSLCILRNCLGLPSDELVYSLYISLTRTSNFESLTSFRRSFLCEFWWVAASNSYNTLSSLLYALKSFNYDEIIRFLITCFTKYLRCSMLYFINNPFKKICFLMLDSLRKFTYFSLLLRLFYLFLLCYLWFSFSHRRTFCQD